MLNDEYTTDAVPSPPRSRKNYSSNEKRKPKVSESGSEEDKKKTHQNTQGTIHQSGKVSVYGAEKFKRDVALDKLIMDGFVRQKYGTHRSGKLVYITGCTNIQFGNSYHIGSEKVQKKVIKETEKMMSLKNSSETVTTRDIDIVSRHMGVGWEDTARALDFSDGEIYNFEERHPKNLKQVLYSLLLDWIQHYADKATVGVLAQILWDKGQREALKLWSENYDKIHESDNTYF